MLKITPGPGQESVWDYPRPPRLESSPHNLKVMVQGVVIASSTQTQRVLETSHPPVYYFPPEDVQLGYLQLNPQRTGCEWKGVAQYYDLDLGNTQIRNIAWAYLAPSPAFQGITGYLAFYPSKVEAYVDTERVQSQPGDFYGGWITEAIVGPFKGAPGTWGW
ncbi:DUF427 domain-containing protein [Candidatus Cyanaurora vandensis]|uniref:DUF427 domain-containing protein n=1 Tax=Candidatus Cyanaurora vandensis TaxID=2714958 RepID=UPI00257D10CC|nr:DUF427 domain-containing protein [Candidatus Cyanaurora vandensis]